MSSLSMKQNVDHAVDDSSAQRVKVEDCRVRVRRARRQIWKHSVLN